MSFKAPLKMVFFRDSGVSSVLVNDRFANSLFRLFHFFACFAPWREKISISLASRREQSIQLRKTNPENVPGILLGIGSAANGKVRIL